MVFDNPTLQRLQELKDRCGMTNEEIGRRAGLSTATVQRYLAGSTKDAPIASVEKVILAMGGDPDDILNGKDEQDKDMELVLYKTLLQETRADHKEEIERLTCSHREIISDKNKWMNRLFWVCVVLGILFVVVLVWAFKLDSMISDYGFVQWVE